VDLCLKAGKLEEAEQVYRELLHLNPENYNYYTGLQKAMGLSPDGTVFLCFLYAYLLSASVF